MLARPWSCRRAGLRWLELTAPEELILAPGSTSALTVERVYLVASLT